MFFLLIRSTQKKQRVPKVSKRVCPYIHVWCPYIHVWVYIIYFLFVLMHTLRQSLSETYIALLCNYYWLFYIKGEITKIELFSFHPILIHFLLFYFEKKS
jgi:hypothetical protein